VLGLAPRRIHVPRLREGRVNELLRDHVTSAAFILSLGKTHVFALVKLDLELTAEVRLDYAALRSVSGGLNRMDMTALQGLERRGLVVRVWEKNKHRYARPATHPMQQGQTVYDTADAPRSAFYNITRAGRLVIDLLREAGLYAEYAGPLLPLVEERKPKRRAS
jgi:hypothetical protein